MESFRDMLNKNIEDVPRVYSKLRLELELSKQSINEIYKSLEFEMALYEQIPELLERNYYSVEHFLDYISLVKKYKESIGKAGDHTPDF